MEPLQKPFSFAISGVRLVGMIFDVQPDYASMQPAALPVIADMRETAKGKCFDEYKNFPASDMTREIGSLFLHRFVGWV